MPQLGRASTPTKDFKGIIVEVEYRPVSNLTIAQPILNEFITILQQVCKVLLPMTRCLPLLSFASFASSAGVPRTVWLFKAAVPHLALVVSRSIQVYMHNAVVCLPCSPPLGHVAGEGEKWGGGGGGGGYLSKVCAFNTCDCWMEQAIATHQAEWNARGSAEERCSGQLERVPAPFAEYSLAPQFSFQHAAAQYVAVCSALLATSRPAVAAS